jgi:hypothetical protein
MLTLKFRKNELRTSIKFLLSNCHPSECLVLVSRLPLVVLVLTPFNCFYTALARLGAAVSSFGCDHRVLGAAPPRSGTLRSCTVQCAGWLPRVLGCPQPCLARPCSHWGRVVALCHPCRARAEPSSQPRRCHLCRAAPLADASCEPARPGG